MRYFANPSTPKVRDAMSAGLIDCIVTPREGKQPPPGARWCADNGRFGQGFPGVAGWAAWLRRMVDANGRDRCAFAVVPDEVADAGSTLLDFARLSDVVRQLGIPVAFVAQDGQESLPVPWDELDVLFIGGSTDWKLSGHARTLVAEAKRRGKQVHMGRVNSHRRLAYARHIGCDSADGTFIARGPDVNLPRALAWLRRLDAEPELFGARS